MDEVVINQDNAARDGLLVRRYGGGTCPLCHAVHDEGERLIESGGSRAFVETLLAHMSRAYQQAGGNQKKRSKCMIGALIPTGRGQVLIAASGQGDRPVFLQAARQMPGTHVCGNVPDNVTTRGGTPITAAQLQEWHADNEPLNCAAPKLIYEARQRGYQTPWDMTEILFDERMHALHSGEITKARADWATKSRQSGFTKHGWSIASCATCANVVPALMCPQ